MHDCTMVYTEVLLGSLTCFSILTACYKARTRSAPDYNHKPVGRVPVLRPFKPYWEKQKKRKNSTSGRVKRVRTWVFPIRFKWSQDRDSANRVLVVVRSTTRPRLVQHAVKIEKHVKLPSKASVYMIVQWCTVYAVSCMNHACKMYTVFSRNHQVVLFFFLAFCSFASELGILVHKASLYSMYWR